MTKLKVRRLKWKNVKVWGPILHFCLEIIYMIHRVHNWETECKCHVSIHIMWLLKFNLTILTKLKIELKIKNT